MMATRLIELTNVIIRQLVIRSDLKPTFATKLSSLYNVSLLDKCPRPYRARIRVSLMPQRIADIVEVGTVPIKERIKSLKYILDKHIECHINFSPVILYNGWVNDYIDLFKQIDEEVHSHGPYMTNKLKNWLKCEVIFLTHHPKLLACNLG